MRSVELKAPQIKAELEAPPELTGEALLAELCAGRILVAGSRAQSTAITLVTQLGLPVVVHVDTRRHPDAWELY